MLFAKPFLTFNLFEVAAIRSFFFPYVAHTAIHVRHFQCLEGFQYLFPKRGGKKNGAHIITN
ncbi:hypothetical protein C7N43_01750 [Sphingobacteriales bacterium UPWRP_1]|nr:hypothetical protein B6N25_15095 [Sphingobacteriales bacterium TSM_CSS]PSJ78750.1 hypothetical protein C7N43_01750 [Sphingobacteriales bacterium UPWRP_1]